MGLFMLLGRTQVKFPNQNIELLFLLCDRFKDHFVWSLLLGPHCCTMWQLLERHTERVTDEGDIYTNLYEHTMYLLIVETLLCRMNTQREVKAGVGNRKRRVGDR